MGGDATQSEAGGDALVDHALTDICHGGQRSTTRTSLNREALLEVATVDNHLGSLLGQQDVARVLGVADGT